MKIYQNLSLLIAGLWLAGCTSRSETPKQPDKPTVPVIQLTRQDATLDRDYASQLEAVQNVEVRARVAGYLDKMLVDEGQSVHKGQLLFQLNPAECQVDVDVARAEFLPSLNLTGYLGLNSFRLGTLIKPASVAAGLLSGLSAPVFNRRFIRANYRRSVAQSREAFYRYRQTIVNGFSE